MSKPLDRSVDVDDLAEISFPESGAAVSFRLLQDAVVPRPVYLVSTIASTGVSNVAPCSYISPAAQFTIARPNTGEAVV